jgi:hypothetical protein
MSAALGAVAVGAVTALVVAGQPRLTLGLPGERVDGADTPVAAALALVALAGAAAVLLMRSQARRVVGVVLVAVSVGIVAAFLAPADQVTYTVYDVAGGGSGLARSAWVWLGSTGGVVAAAGGVGVAVRAGRWPEPRRRFEATERDRVRPDDPWGALDRGEDPTA